MATLSPLHDRDGWIWLDGEFLAWRDAKLHYLTHSLHYGMGVFEGVRAYATERGPAIFRLDEHTRRLYNSAKIFQMELPFDMKTMREVQIDVIRRNRLDACYIRPLAWLGSEQLGLGAQDNTVHVGVAAWQMPAYLGSDALASGVAIKTSSYTRHHVNVAMVRAKASGYYVNSILAHREVKRSGYDEALLLDTEGYVSEGAGENLFIARDGVVYTPDVASCLDGITRASVIQLAKDEGLTVIEKRMTRDEVYCADEAFFTGTAVEVTPIRELDDRTIGQGMRGPITTLLQSRYFDVVAGRSQKYREWLTYVDA